MNKKKQPNPTDRLFIHFNAEATTVSRKELGELVLLPGARLNPLRHELISDWVVDYLSERDETIRDAFYAVSNNHHRWLGLFQIRARVDRSVERIICMLNSNDGHDGLEIHTGLVVPGAGNALVFNYGNTIARKYTFLAIEDIHTLVNENLRVSEAHHPVEMDRVDHYKSFTFTQKDARSVVCDLLTSEIIAGRCAREFIRTWESPVLDYLRPRTAWSLFCHSAIFINRLRSQEILVRTKLLHDFMDSVVKFNRKATIWLQPNLV